MKKVRKRGSGGKRPNAGAKPKPYRTKLINLCVPTAIHKGLYDLIIETRENYVRQFEQKI